MAALLLHSAVSHAAPPHHPWLVTVAPTTKFTQFSASTAQMQQCDGTGVTCIGYAAKRWDRCNGCNTRAVQVSYATRLCPMCFIERTPTPCMCTATMALLNAQQGLLGQAPPAPLRPLVVANAAGPAGPSCAAGRGMPSRDCWGRPAAAAYTEVSPLLLRRHFASSASSSAAAAARYTHENRPPPPPAAGPVRCLNPRSCSCSHCCRTRRLQAEFSAAAAIVINDNENQPAEPKQCKCMAVRGWWSLEARDANGIRDNVFCTVCGKFRKQGDPFCPASPPPSDRSE